MYDPTKPYKKEILEIIKQTQKRNQPLFIVSTDGIGTKGIWHWKNRSFKNAVLDSLAMNLNDLLMKRFIPEELCLADHIFLPEDDHKAFINIVSFLAEECIKRKIEILGGESSVHSDMSGLEISISVFGQNTEKCLPDNVCNVGDVLIGIPSNGMHSNGYTKVNSIFGDAIYYTGSDFLADFLKPTRMYFDELKDITASEYINAMQHITGGAFTKIKEILVNKKTGEYKMDAVINKLNCELIHQGFFDIYQEYPVSDEEMYSTFNCGIGFVISCSPESKPCLSLPKDAYVIGEIVKGTGEIKIQSQFSGKEVVL